MLTTLIFLGALLLITLGVAAYETYGERKVAAFMQDRIGPDRAGPFGILQPVADGTKMFMKEDFVPANAIRWLYFLGPAIAMSTALLTGVVIPWGGTVTVGDFTMSLQAADPEIGILYVFADQDAHFKSDATQRVLNVPHVHPLIAPIVYTVPLQLLSYYVAIIKGTDVDQPRNLAKSVTVE